MNSTWVLITLSGSGASQQTPGLICWFKFLVVSWRLRIDSTDRLVSSCAVRTILFTAIWMRLSTVSQFPAGSTLWKTPTAA